MKSVIAICLLLIVMAGCSDKKTVAPDINTFNLSGRVINQYGNAAPGLRVVVSGSNNYSASTTTDTSGTFTVKAPEGASAVTFSSAQTIVFSLPRFITRDTVINVTADTSLNLTVREFTTIFHDSANRPSAWNMYGGVSYDSTKYVFQDLDMVNDHMMQNQICSMPDSFQYAGFILYGQAAPSNSSEIIVNAWINGHVFNGHWSAAFTVTPSYYHGALETLPALPGGGLQLDLIYNKISATYIYIRDIWIYCY